jgi:RimJ/RimL family protein N-acetyltransferase
MRPAERIEAGAVLLDRWRPEDTRALLTAVTESLEHLRPWMPWVEPPPTLASLGGFILRSRQPFEEGGTDYVYGIFDLERRTILGGCGLHARRGPGVVEIGYWVHVAHTRHGHATAATDALARTALALPHITRVEIRCDVANLASAAVARGLGFRLDGTVDGVTAPGGLGRSSIWVRERDQRPTAG